MKSLAIIGTGIAGMACGYALHQRFNLTVYEKNDYAGGHTNTVMVPENGRDIPVDTGFMVYNETTYPLLTQLFKDLGVDTKPTSMSFSVQHRPTGLEFCGSGLNGLFAQRQNLVKVGYWRMLLEIQRFNREAPALLENSTLQDLTLRDYAQRYGYSWAMLDRYLIPMSSAVWSTPPNEMLDFPIVTLIRFFMNHGFLGLHTQHPWRTVVGGSRSYRDKIIAPFRDRIRLACPAIQVTRQNGKVFVSDARGQRSEHDLVILAAHADESLALLADATTQEKALLSAFRYQGNRATLHTDASVMPQTRGAWSSWNYRTETSGRSSTVYWMNSLQQVSQHQNYFVSINDPGQVDPARIVKTIDYDHPVFTLDAMRAQARLPQLNENGVTYFCGSYFRYGFHEDALMSAMDVVRRLS